MITMIFNDIIWFEYKGDEVGWNGKQYISICTYCGYDTLEDLDKFWDDYWKASMENN